jgi:hypothetical protein
VPAASEAERGSSEWGRGDSGVFCAGFLGAFESLGYGESNGATGPAKRRRRWTDETEPRRSEQAPVAEQLWRTRLRAEPQRREEELTERYSRQSGLRGEAEQAVTEGIDGGVPR